MRSAELSMEDEDPGGKSPLTGRVLQIVPARGAQAGVAQKSSGEPLP